jgi:hypothetical protein
MYRHTCSTLAYAEIAGALQPAAYQGVCDITQADSRQNFGHPVRHLCLCGVTWQCQSKRVDKQVSWVAEVTVPYHTGLTEDS